MTIFDEIEQKGIEKGIEIVALKLWQKGVQPSMIADLLDLPIERVEELTANFEEK